MTHATSDGTRGGPRTRVVLLVWAAASAVLAWSILRIDVPLVNDGPAHLYAAYVADHYDDAAAGYARFWDVSVPLTRHGFIEIFDVFDLFLGFAAAYRATVAAIAVLSALCFAVFVHVLAPRRFLLGLLAFPAAYQWGFFLGFFPFVVGIAVALLFLALVVRGERSPPPTRNAAVTRHALWALALFLVAVVHPMPAAAAGLAMTGVVVGALPSLQPRALVAGLVRCAIVGVPAAVVALIARETYSSEAGAGWPPLLARLRAFGPFFQCGPAWRWGFFLAAAGAGVVAALIVAARAKDDAQEARVERGVAVAAMALALASLAAPWTLNGFELMAPRLMPFPAYLGLALVPVERLAPLWRGRARWAAAAAVGVYGAASFAWGAGTMARVEASCAYATRGLHAAVPRAPYTTMPLNGAYCPVVDELDDEIPRFQPTFHLAQLYSVAFGGFSGNANFGAARSFQLQLKPGAPSFGAGDYRVDWRDIRAAKTPEERRRLTRDYLERARSVGGVVAMMNADDVDLARALGYRDVVVDGGFYFGVY